jgi:hypothetical protein
MEFKRGHEVPREWREKIRKANLGRKQSEETKRKRSISLKKAHQERHFNKGKCFNPNKGKGKGFIDKKGYARISVYPKQLKVHHLIWLKANQLHRLPNNCVIHHLNGNKLDNQIHNLQLLTKEIHDKL